MEKGEGQKSTDVFFPFEYASVNENALHAEAHIIYIHSDSKM